MLGRDELDSTLLTCDHGNFNQITAWSWDRTQVTVVRDTCTTSVPPAHVIKASLLFSSSSCGLKILIFKLSARISV